MRTLTNVLVTTVLLTGSQAALAVDPEHGKSLAEQNCMTCHDNGVYTREDRRITSMDALRNQVQRCETNLNLKWFPEDVDAVIDYLNTTFYHFK